MTEEDWVYGILFGIGIAFLVLLFVLIGVYVALLLTFL